MIYLLIILLAIVVTNIILKVDKSDVIWKNRFFYIGYVVAWYDLYAGFYKDRGSYARWYIMLPTFGFIFIWYKQTPTYIVFVIAELEEVIVAKKETYYNSTTFYNLATKKDFFWFKSKGRKRARELAQKFGYEYKDLTGLKDLDKRPE